MKTVATTGKLIVDSDYNLDPEYLAIAMDVITVAWLHDVCDHKYDHDGTLEQQLDVFGTIHIPNYKEIKQVIKLTSYSSENKAMIAKTPIDYEKLLGNHYAIVRHIVSDADKLEAIGSIGIERCIEYIYHMNPSITANELNKAVHIHANEKLLRLKDEFIRTTTGKRLAIPLHQEMIDILQKIKINTDDLTDSAV
jgi:HD superfamily phosphodiesterase